MSYFTQRQVRPGELPAIMRKHIATGTMGSTWGTIITGIIYVYFGNAIGLTRLQWGILGGISACVVVMQSLGTLLAERVGSRRLVWFWTALADRVLRMIGIVGAFLLWRDGSTAGYLVFMAAVCLGPFIGNISPGPWYGWLGHTFSGHSFPRSGFSRCRAARCSGSAWEGVVGGVFSAAAANASVKLAIRFSAPEDSGVYMAVSTMIGSLAGGLGILTAGIFLNVMGAWSTRLFGLVVSAFPLLFAGSTVLRFATIFLLLPRVRATPSAQREERSFLLPLFFEGIPGITRNQKRR